MRLTTIGTGTVSPSPTRVCAGHLVEAGDARVLMDCGSGVLHRMAALAVRWQAITHVAITHFHPDHTSDLPLLIMAWRYGDLPPRSEPAVVVGPPGTEALLIHFAGVYGRWVLEPGFPLAVRELAPGGSLDLGGGATIEARKVPHTAESVAYSVSHAGARAVYTGDTAFDRSLGEWAAGCDVLLCECSLPRAMAVPSHLTPEECGELAAVAVPALLALTHFYPPVERVDIRALVAERYGGRVELATDGWTTEIPGTPRT
jgi:ribonuclease BN (tRNA processing enzyme)